MPRRESLAIGVGDWTAIDSRDYIVAFEIHSADDCPPDFTMPATLGRFEAGLFLPRDDPDWFGRSRYPPRVLLLRSNALQMFPHPSANEPHFDFQVGQISAIESGHMLLKGWLRFIGFGFDQTVQYNTRGFRSVFRFMCRLREKLLGRGAFVTPEGHLGGSLDLKFANALSRELDSGEKATACLFQPPKEQRSNRLLFPRRQWRAGDLLALTGRRLLWITDRERGSYSPYGSIASYAPLRALRSIQLSTGRSGNVLHVQLEPPACWDIPISPENVREAADFSTFVASTLISRSIHRI